MTDADPPGQSSGSEEAATRPGDVPTTRPDSLESLEVLVGDWDMEARFHEGYFGAGSPPITAEGAARASSGWKAGVFSFSDSRSTTPMPLVASPSSGWTNRARSLCSTTSTLVVWRAGTT